MIYNYLKVLLLCLLAFIGCEDIKDPQPSGTLRIAINTPSYVYLDDWWDYASKYEIYVNNKLKGEASFNNSEITTIDTEVGFQTVSCVITDAFGVRLYVMEKTTTVHEGLVTELDFNDFYIAEYPTADYTNDFTSLDDFLNVGGYEIFHSRLYAISSTETDKQLEWKSAYPMTTPIRVAIDVESTWNDSIFVGVGLGNSSTNDYHMFFLTEINISLMKYDGATGYWTTISQLANSSNKNGTLLMIFDVDYFWCYLNDILVVWGDSYDEAFDTVNIYHWGKSGAYYDNLRVYNNNAKAMRIINNGKSPKFSIRDFN